MKEQRDPLNTGTFCDGSFQDGPTINGILRLLPTEKAPSGSAQDDRVTGVYSAAFSVPGQVQILSYAANAHHR
jgi:hypothetical protein